MRLFHDSIAVACGKAIDAINVETLSGPAVSAYLRMLGRAVVAGGLATFAEQLAAIAAQVATLAASDAKGSHEVELIVAESAFPAFGRFYGLAPQAIVVRPGVKDSKLLDTYRLVVVVDVQRLGDAEAFIGAVRKIKDDLMSEADELYRQVDDSARRLPR